MEQNHSTLPATVGCCNFGNPPKKPPYPIVEITQIRHMLNLLIDFEMSLQSIRHVQRWHLSILKQEKPVCQRFDNSSLLGLISAGNKAPPADGSSRHALPVTWRSANPAPLPSPQTLPKATLESAHDCSFLQPRYGCLHRCPNIVPTSCGWYTCCICF